MSEIENTEIPLPAQKEGEQKDIVTRKKAATKEEAIQLYEKAKTHLLNINNWADISGKGSAIFKLTDENGEEVNSIPKVGDHFKIDIPALKSKTGKGFDWVRVEAIEEHENVKEDTQFIIMRVRPSANPFEKSEATAHFFSNKSTSNFLVLREKKNVIAAVLGRNEIPNTASPKSFFDKIRNAIVGIGAVAGISNPQWKRLVNGLLRED